MIRIALVDDHSMFRQGLASVIPSVPGMEVVLKCNNGQEFLDQYFDLNVDIALLDLEMPVLNGIETLEKLQQKKDSVSTIIVSSNKEPHLISSLMELGAKGYMLKEADTDELTKAILSVHETGFYFNDLVSQAMLVRLASKDEINPTFNGNEHLSEREKEVLQLICEEFTTQEIGDKLFISHRTVENHRKRVLDKCGARNTAGLVVFAVKNNLVNVG